MKKYIGQVDCIMCGKCCGYRNNQFFGGCYYSEKEDLPPDVVVVKEKDGFRIPVDENDVCIYLEKLDNGFAKCKIQEKKPIMCKLYYCLIEKKVKSLENIIEYLKVKCKEEYEGVNYGGTDINIRS